MTPEEFVQWRFEHDRLEAQLRRVEAAERAILEQIGCPVDRAAIWNILDGRVKRPWPKRTTARDQERAKHAMFVLHFVSEIRHHTNPGTEHAIRAAQAALKVGALANDAFIRARQGAGLTTTSRKGGTARAKAIAAAAVKHDHEIAKYQRQWHNSDELQEQYGSRSPVNYIRHKTRLSTRTIQRALKRRSRQ
jgi:hypothetical protein